MKAESVLNHHFNKLNIDIWDLVRIKRKGIIDVNDHSISFPLGKIGIQSQQQDLSRI